MTQTVLSKVEIDRPEPLQSSKAVTGLAAATIRNESNADCEFLTSQKEHGGDFPVRRRVNPVRDIMGAHRATGGRRRAETS